MSSNTMDTENAAEALEAVEAVKDIVTDIVDDIIDSAVGSSVDIKEVKWQDQVEAGFEPSKLWLFPDPEDLPSKLRHIKNKTYLNNSLDPLTGKYVKIIWAYKQTKLDRTKRDMIWQYFRHRNRKSVGDALRESFYKNVINVTIIYFGDPIQHNFDLTREISYTYKLAKIHRQNVNRINPFNNKKVSALYYKKKIKGGTKNKRVWDMRDLEIKPPIGKSETTSVTNMVKKLWHNQNRSIVFEYEDKEQEEVELTEELFNSLN